MTAFEEIPHSASSRPPAAPHHAVQFYEDEEFLYGRVADYLADGLNSGERAVVIAMPEHRQGFVTHLRAKGFDLDDAEIADRVLLLDAHDTLRQFSVGSNVDEKRFVATVGGVIERLSQSQRRVRAYGEMVDVLWRKGETDAAIRLEELWNDLALRQTFSLLCAYPIGNFSREADTPHFEAICERHGQVVPTETFTRAIDENARAREVSLLQQRAAILEREIEKRKELEQTLRDALSMRRQAEEQNAFLLEATSVLMRSLDYHTRLTGIIRVIVPRIADWCAIDIVSEDGTCRRVGSAHRDPANDELLLRMPEIHPAPKDRDAVADVVKSGSPKFIPNFNVAALEAFAHSAEHARELEKLGTHSLIIAPMKLGDRVLGAITFAAGDSGRRFAEADLAFIVELTRRTGVALENARLYQLAQEANRTKDEFLATVSHELRTPLTSILGWARMLNLGGLDQETKITALKTIERSARTQASLIDDLLDVSRIVTGKLSLETELVDLTTIVANVGETLRVAADAKNIRVDVGGAEERLVVSGDPTRLQQIVWNLISNSIKFSSPGGSVSVVVERHERTARMIVTDTGRGISNEFLPHVFEPFRQADGGMTRAQGGLGLGLAIVKYLTEAHGGTVKAASSGEGLGATFTVVLPLALEVAEEPLQFARTAGLRE